MARLRNAVPDNVPGELFVDRSCIDCDACRQIAAEVFTRSASTRMSRVHAQPTDPKRALMALVSCPTASIGTRHKQDLGPALDALPENIDGPVYFCGYCSESSYGALSYLIRRDAGNVLVDSPRANKPLLERMEKLGGVSTMFLTHRDDVADHARFAARFGACRIIHSADAGRGLESIERKLSGDDPVALSEDLLAIPVPGHTRGSMVLLFQERFLFTGDHLEWDDDLRRLEAWRHVCWYSWPEQTRSMERLLDYPFEWVLPGHGRRHLAAAPRMREQLVDLIGRMKASA